MPIVLSGFQRYFCMQYTTFSNIRMTFIMLFYQDFKDTFVCNTQPGRYVPLKAISCFIRISKILLYAIHNSASMQRPSACVVSSGFQRYFCMQYTTQMPGQKMLVELFYQDFNEQFCCKSTEKIGNMQIYEKYFVI